MTDKEKSDMAFGMAHGVMVNALEKIVGLGKGVSQSEGPKLCDAVRIAEDALEFCGKVTGKAELP